MKRRKHPTEADEQAVVFSWARLVANQWPELHYMFHIPNGGHRNRIVAAKMTGQGVKPGVPDIFLPISRGNYHGLWIEMKAGHGGTVSDAQAAWIDYLRAQGYSVCVARGAEMAIGAITVYLTGESCPTKPTNG